MTPDLYHSLVCQQGVRPNTWQQHQYQQVGQCQHEVPGQVPLSSDYLVLLAHAWRTNPANRLPLHRIVRQLDLFIQQEQLWYEAQQLLITRRMPTTNHNNGYSSTNNNNNNNNDEQSLLHQSFSDDNMNTRQPTVARPRDRQYCGSSSSVASCGKKRNRRFVTETNNNNTSNATFLMNRNTSSGMLRPFTMHDMNHTNKNYQQHHCDVMHAARKILSTDPMIMERHRFQQQFQQSQSRSNVSSQQQYQQQYQQQQQQQQQFQQQQQTTMCSPDHYYYFLQQQQQTTTTDAVNL